MLFVVLHKKAGVTLLLVLSQTTGPLFVLEPCVHNEQLSTALELRFANMSHGLCIISVRT